MSHVGQKPASWHIAGWEVLGRIARGSTADILLARPDLTGEVTPASLSLGLSSPLQGEQRVILKRLYPHLAANEEFVRMFVDEVRLMSMLRSDNIVDVYDLDEDDETFYAVVELIDGPSLSAALRLHQKQHGNPAIAIDVAARILADICDALAVVHSAKDAHGAALDLVHRDVNPQNILVGRDNVVKLSDFGVARSSLLRKSGSLVASGTDAGVLKGKASYLAPEQVKGAAVDHRADLFAVGVTLYVAITGYAPFVGGSDVELLNAIAHQPPQPPSTLAKLPKPLEALTLALLEKDPSKRPASAADVKAELAAFAGSADVVGSFVRALGLPSLRA